MIETLKCPSMADHDSGTLPAEQRQGRWLQAVSHLDPKYGGVSTVVPQLGANLVREGLGIELASFSAIDETCALASHPGLASTHWPASRSAWLAKAALRARFRQELTEVDGVHVHGLWETHGSVAAHMARSLRKPYIVSAHGMLEPWALANKGLKKRLYSALVERSNLEGAACLHALTLAEAKDYRRFGSGRPIAVIPNGIALPPNVDGSLFLNRFPELVGKRVVLFLGRLHFKKGIDILIEAWGEVANRFSGAVLVLAGPDCEGTRSSIQPIIDRCGLTERVVFTGMLASEMKWSALANAYCFTLPSYSEGLSVAVLEAMGMGLPVIVSDRCHLPEIARHNAGWQIAAKVPDLIGALEHMLSNTAAMNAEIGSHGRRLVHDRFTWPVVARQMAELYGWVLGGAKPRSFDLLEENA